MEIIRICWLTEKDKIDLYESYRDKRTEKTAFIDGKSMV